MVCIIGMFARHTGEGGLIGSVLLVDTAALGALPRGVAWIDIDDGNASAAGLVSYKASKLREAPVTQSCALIAAGRYPLANPFEFFNGDPPRGAFSIQHDSLGDAVVYVFLIPRLLSCQLAQPAFRGLGAALLESVAALLGTTTLSFNVGTCIDRAIAIDGQGYDAEIDTKPVLGLKLVGFRDVASGGQHPLSTYKAKINLALAKGHQRLLVLAHYDRNGDAPLDGPDTDRSAVLDEADNAVVVGLGGVGAEMPLRLAIQLVGVGYLADATDRRLSRQSETLPHFDISDLVQRVLPECRGVPGKRRKPVARLVAARQRRHQAFGLGGRRHKLHGGNQLHAIKNRGGFPMCQVWMSPAPPRPEGRGFRRAVLG